MAYNTAFSAATWRESAIVRQYFTQCWTFWRFGAVSYSIEGKNAVLRVNFCTDAARTAGRITGHMHFRELLNSEPASSALPAEQTASIIR